MKIDAARYEGGELIFSTTDPAARRMVYEFKPGEYELRRRKERRSLDANAYAWVLIDKIAAATGLGKTNVTLIYGSSVYDTNQMSRLIDALVQDAKALGIETLPPWQLEGMIEQWDAAPGQKPSL